MDHTATTHPHVNNTLLVMAILVFWTGLCFVGKYGKQWLGNQQEVYPTLLLPGFVRNPEKTGHSEFVTRHLVLKTAQGQDTKVAPDAAFGYFGWFIAGQLLSRDSLLAVDEPEQWMLHLPDSVAQVTFVEEIFSLTDGRDGMRKTLLSSRSRHYTINH